MECDRVHWCISSRALFLGERWNRRDILIVRRIENPFSIHHLHTEHPWVLPAPCISPSPLGTNRPWEGPAKTNKSNKNATEALCSALMRLYLFFFTVFKEFILCLLVFYFPHTCKVVTFSENYLGYHEARSPHQTVIHISHLCCGLFAAHSTPSVPKS